MFQQCYFKRQLRISFKKKEKSVKIKFGEKKKKKKKKKTVEKEIVEC